MMGDSDSATRERLAAGAVLPGASVPSSAFRDLKEAGRVTPGRHVLGVVSFTAGVSPPELGEGYPSVAISMTDTAEDGFAEVWTTDQPVRPGRSGPIAYACAGDFLFGVCHIPELPGYTTATEDAYTAAVELVGSLGYGRMFRIWHYISGVNEQSEAGLEVYREFCVGRARALEKFGIAGEMPAATVIGANGGGIVFYFLASRTGTRVHIDNPRQVPPYHYPARYGPRSPNFARATYLSTRDGREQLYVSGTAGILGHRTMHPGDVAGQCRLALDNIAHVIGRANLSAHGVGPGSSLGELRQVKVYVRREADFAVVRRICRAVFSPAAEIVFLHADICRADLLVEIEGIVTRERTPVRALSAATNEPAVTAAAAASWEALPAAQQPDWHTHPDYGRVRARLTEVPPLVRPGELATLRAQLAAAAAGSARVLQLGDCAESFYETTPDHLEAKLAAMELLADRLARRTGQDVVAIGRLGGQYAKPRSQPVELVDGAELAVFRGHLVNAEGPTAEARRHDPVRMLWAYHFSAEAHKALRARRGTTDRLGPWSSHDALVMDYLGPLVRTDEETGELFLGSTHFPWIGERTGGAAEAQVKLLSLVVNPVACKIGPRATPEQVLRLCELLDPGREPGRLTLIARLGADRIADGLPPLVRAVRGAGHRVLWLSDPMHGNTVRLPSGIKTRQLDRMAAEARDFRRILEAHGQHAGGLHLETAAAAVTECVGGSVAEDDVAREYTSLCDPRLNPDQAAALIDLVFPGELRGEPAHSYLGM